MFAVTPWPDLVNDEGACALVVYQAKASFLGKNAEGAGTLVIYQARPRCHRVLCRFGNPTAAALAISQETVTPQPRLNVGKATCSGVSSLE